MAKICYIPKTFSEEKRNKIRIVNEIISDYSVQGFDLTVRQIYYQFVARGHLPNRPEEYSRLQDLLNDARLSGDVNWDAIVDRTRNLESIRHWEHPRDILADGANRFNFWKWEGQPNYVEVWVEKDALKSIVASVCNPLDVAYFSCRGYTSVSEVHSAALRFQHEINHGKEVRVIHLGDHDPSGLDMTRDITERLQKVFNVNARIYRCALNMNQIEEFSPPPNPAKLTDSRCAGYIEKHGESSWELDALEPSVLVGIVRRNVLHWRDDALWAKALAKESRAREVLNSMHARWNEIYQLMQGPPEGV